MLKHCFTVLSLFWMICGTALGADAPLPPVPSSEPVLSFVVPTPTQPGFWNPNAETIYGLFTAGERETKYHLKKAFRIALAVAENNHRLNPSPMTQAHIAEVHAAWSVLDEDAYRGLYDTFLRTLRQNESRVGTAAEHLELFQAYHRHIRADDQQGNLRPSDHVVEFANFFHRSAWASLYPKITRVTPWAGGEQHTPLGTCSYIFSNLLRVRPAIFVAGVLGAGVAGFGVARIQTTPPPEQRLNQQQLEVAPTTAPIAPPPRVLSAEEEAEALATERAKKLRERLQRP